MKKKVIAAVVIVVALLLSAFILLHGITVASLSIDKNEIVVADNLLVSVSARHIGVPFFGGFATPHLTIVKEDNSDYKIFDLHPFGYVEASGFGNGKIESGWYWSHNWQWLINMSVGSYATIDNYQIENRYYLPFGMEEYYNSYGLSPVETGLYIVHFDILGKGCTLHLSINGVD